MTLRRVDFNESLDEKYFWKETQFAVVLLLTTRENTAPEFVEPLHVILDDNIGNICFHLINKGFPRFLTFEV